MTLSTDSTPQSDHQAGQSDEQSVPPLRREVMVSTNPETAFALFTAHIDRWWPLARHSVFGGDAMVAFEGDAIVERLGEQSSVWAEVTAWDPPGSLSLSWHPGRDGSRSTDITITFEGLDDGTLVRLVHSGWERTEAPAAAAAEYAQGWSVVLAGYAASLTAATTDADVDTGRWFALVHTPGPALPDGESIFAHPSFAEHFAFLERLRERGLLVAAGPISEERGEGMTIVRALPEHDDVDVDLLVRTDDASVAGGFLEVEVRPWSVRLVG
jgi:uncharacterized protein YndB with AHSA1/START domain/uncharacterized protein YciI